MLNTRSFLRVSLAALAAGSLTLAACSPSEEDSAAAPSSAATSAEKDKDAEASTSASSSAESGVTFEDAVVRAMEKDSDMTAIFGTLHNNTDKDINVVGFSSSVKAKHYEIHEVVDGVMQEKEGGIVIPAGGTYELKPGGDHFMVMGYPDEIPAGDTVDVTLLTEGGTTIDIPEVAVRTMLPGDEDYGEDGQVMDHSQHKHGDDAAHGEHAEHSETAEHKH